MVLSEKSILYANGQLWAEEKAVEEAGYDGTLGEIVAIAETHELFELAARVGPYRVGISNARDDWVWWLLPLKDVLPTKKRKKKRG